MVSRCFEPQQSSTAVGKDLERTEPLRSDLAATRRASFLRSIELGHALDALSRATDSPLTSMPFGHLIDRLLHASHLAQIRLLFSESGRCEGWLSWAWLSHEGMQLLRRSGLSALHPCQWDEGRQLCVIDEVFTAAAGTEPRDSMLRAVLEGSIAPLRYVAEGRRFEPVERPT